MHLEATGRRAAVCLGLVVALAFLGGCGGDGQMAVYNIDPRAGSLGGQQAVRITGANFRQDIGYTVYFGAKRAPRVQIPDSSTLLVVTPEHDQGPVDVVVVSDSGPAWRIHHAFTFQDQGGNVVEQMGEQTGPGNERF